MWVSLRLAKCYILALFWTAVQLVITLYSLKIQWQDFPHLKILFVEILTKKHPHFIINWNTCQKRSLENNGFCSQKVFKYSTGQTNHDITYKNSKLYIFFITKYQKVERKKVFALAEVWVKIDLLRGACAVESANFDLAMRRISIILLRSKKQGIIG